MKLFFGLFILFIPISANAQLSKGLKQLGGALSVSYNTSDFERGAIITRPDTKINTFILRPNVGFLLRTI
ncbi:MAG: hypothetical protein AAGI07_02795 [Bacteroidota bacterium]